MIDGADLELFAQSLQHANTTHSGAGLDAALVEVGWHDALAEDRRAAISIQFEQQGRANATSSALDHVVAGALGRDEPIAAVLPSLGGWAPPGERSDGPLVVTGVGTGALTGQDRVLVASTSGAKVIGAVVRTDVLRVRSVRGVDPDFGLVLVRGSVPETVEEAPGDWSEAVDLARLAIGHELVGASRTMLELACTHALERMQFGQPIAGFQAVRHRLAEALVAIEAAVAMLDAAWLDGTGETAAMAKAVAGRSARTVVRHCQQVLAGIGFTTEHPFHRYHRRVLVLDELFGNARVLTTALGAAVLASGRPPSLLPL